MKFIHNPTNLRQTQYFGVLFSNPLFKPMVYMNTYIDMIFDYKQLCILLLSSVIYSLVLFIAQYSRIRIFYFTIPYYWTFRFFSFSLPTYWGEYPCM